MNTVLIILALLLALVGVVGAVLPALPGPPLSWLGVLLAYFAARGTISLTLLLILLAVTVVVTVLDYVAPSLMTRWGGGSKAATRGATVGTIAGLFFMPWGLLLGPLAGAFVGEMLHSQNAGRSLRVAAWSFLSFLLSTGLKLMASLWMLWQVASSALSLLP